MPVSQEVYFAHHLAANEKVTRDRALRKLTRWIRAKSGDENTEFTEESLMKLWKGLFFCMWMSDKPFIQQELANSIAGLIHCFANRTQSLLYLDTFFKTMAREWFAIDRFRLEKFMMLVRRCFRQGILCARGSEWEDDGIVDFCNTLKITALCPNSQQIPLGLRLHVADVFLQELARMHGAELSPEQALLFLEPFFDILTQSNEHTLVDVVRKNVFFLAIDLDREAAELGVDPGSVQLNGGEEGEEEEEEMDEYDQHGRVLEKGEASQDLAAIPFDYSMIADKLFDALKTSALKPFNRAVITRMVKKYRAILKEGLVRPPVKDVPVGRAITDDDIEAAASRLEEELEEELEEDREEIDMLKKGRKKTKPSFGFDSASGAYEYIGNDSDSQASDDEADCAMTAKQPRKKLRQGNLHEEAEDTPDDLSHSSEDDLAETEPLTLGRKRKRPAKLKHGAVDSAEKGFEAAKETGKVPKKRARRKKREAGHRNPSDTSQTKHEKNVEKAKNGLNGLDEGMVGIAAKGVHQNTRSPVSKALVVEGKSLLGKKAGPLVLGKAPRKKSLVKKPSGAVQQQLVKPSSGDGCPSEGHIPGEQKVGLLKRRAEVKGKRKRRLSSPNWKVTPVTTEEAEPARAAATPFVTAQTSCGDVAGKLQVSPSTQPLGTSSPTLMPVVKGKSPTAGDVVSSNGGPRESEELGLSAKVAGAKPPSPVVPNDKEVAKSPGIKTPPTSLPCTPQLSKPAGTFFRKCLTAAKTAPSKPVMFLTPPAKPSTPSQEEKKVVFALSRNSAQHPREYFETLKNSPQIPFDASKKPAQGVLKARLSLASSTTSPARPKKRSRASDFF